MQHIEYTAWYAISRVHSAKQKKKILVTRYGTAVSHNSFKHEQGPGTVNT